MQEQNTTPSEKKGQNWKTAVVVAAVLLVGAVAGHALLTNDQPAGQECPASGTCALSDKAATAAQTCPSKASACCPSQTSDCDKTSESACPATEGAAEKAGSCCGSSDTAPQAASACGGCPSTTPAQ